VLITTFAHPCWLAWQVLKCCQMVWVYCNRLFRIGNQCLSVNEWAFYDTVADL